MPTYLELMNDAWNACLEEVLRAVDARCKATHSLELDRLREELLLLRRQQALRSSGRAACQPPSPDV